MAAEDEIAAIVAGRHAAPAQILGWHPYACGTATYNVVRAFRPLERKVWVRDLRSGVAYPARRRHAAGFFEAIWPRADGPAVPRYVLQRLGRNGERHEIEDPYRFPARMTDYDHHLFAEGNLRQAWRKLGAHRRVVEQVPGVHFAVWAPNALRVSVIGPFNAWDERVHPMHVRQGGVWELFIHRLAEGER